MPQLLCLADVHIGRLPSRLPESFSAQSALRPAEVLRSALALARRRELDAVLCGGDLIDSNNFYEAFGSLSHILEEFAHAEIPFISVAGNHDVEVLARLHEQWEHFYVLGLEGNWEAYSFEAKDGLAVRIIGKSFTSEHADDDPLRSLPDAQVLPNTSGKSNADVTIGLLHCDVGAASSSYQPVSLQALSQQALTAWVLGHIHKPSLLSEEPPVVYPGSLTGLHPNETGAHGPWILNLSQHTHTLSHVPLAPLRYERLDVQVEGDVDESGLETAVIDCFRSYAKSVSAGPFPPKMVSARLQFSGRVSNVQAVAAFAGTIVEKEPIALDGIEFTVEQASVACSPALNLAQLSSVAGPPGYLASIVHALQSSTEEQPLPPALAELFSEISEKVRTLYSHGHFAQLGTTSTPSDTEVHALIAQEAGLLLAELLEQHPK